MFIYYMDSYHLNIKKATKTLLLIVVCIYGTSLTYGSGVTFSSGTVTANSSVSSMQALLDLLAGFATFLIVDVSYYLLYISLFIGAAAILLAPGDDLVPVLQVILRIVFTGSMLIGGTNFVVTYVLPSSSII